MTYCVALCLDEGLVFLSDTRTNAGVDQIGTYRKMTLFNKKGDRFFALMGSGNLAVTQAVKELLLQGEKLKKMNLWTAKNTYEAAIVLGEAVRKVYERDMEALQTAGIDFNCNFLFGGQIKGERPRLFHIYAAGNFIESTSETCYFQIGESKYGKPILDRVVKFTTPLNLATKCVLVSMDSTINSNISVGLPLDLVVYEKDKLSVNKMVTIDKDNPYFDMMHNQWADKLKAVFMQIPEPVWDSNKKTISINTPTKKIEPIPIQEEKQARSKTRAKPSSKARK